MTYFEIMWYGSPTLTLDAYGVRPGRVPYGGRHMRTREEAEEKLARFLSRCGQYAGTVRAAHNPRIVQRERIGHD